MPPRDLQCFYKGCFFDVIGFLALSFYIQALEFLSNQICKRRGLCRLPFHLKFSKFRGVIITYIRLLLLLSLTIFGKLKWILNFFLFRKCIYSYTIFLFAVYKMLPQSAWSPKTQNFICELECIWILQILIIIWMVILHKTKILRETLDFHSVFSFFFFFYYSEFRLLVVCV